MQADDSSVTSNVEFLALSRAVLEQCRLDAVVLFALARVSVAGRPVHESYRVALDALHVIHEPIIGAVDTSAAVEMKIQRLEL